MTLVGSILRQRQHREHRAVVRAGQVVDGDAEHAGALGDEHVVDRHRRRAVAVPRRRQAGPGRLGSVAVAAADQLAQLVVVER
jgi:hypothetical protein